MKNSFLKRILKEGFSRARKFLRNLFKNIVQAFKNEPWLTTFISLIWTAGPVCVISLSAGYYMGYGSLPNKQLFLYFSIYILISGLATIIYRIFHNSANSISEQRYNYYLNTSLEKLLALMNTGRSLYLNSLKPSHRKTQEAFIILDNTDATKDDLAIAVSMLSDDDDLLASIRKIEVFRHYGYANRIFEEYEKVKPKLDIITSENNSITAKQAELLHNRFLGKRPSKKIGKPRRSGFVSRLLNYRKTRNYNLATLEDAREALIFAYELLCGRKLKTFSCRINQVSNLLEVSSELELRLNNYRTALNDRNKTIAVLLRFLESENLIHEVTKNTDVNNLAFINVVVEKVTNEIKALVHEKFSDEAKLSKEDLAYFKKLINNLSYILGAYQRIWQETEELLSQINELNKISAQYKKLQEKYFKRLEDLVFKDGSQKFNIDIEDTSIFLSEYEIKIFSEKLFKLFSDLKIDREKLLIKYKQPLSSKSTLNTEDLIELSSSALKILLKYISLRDKNIQATIEGSNSPDFGSIELGLSMKTIVDWSTSLVEDMQDDISNMIYKISQWYVNFKKEKLSNTELNYLQAEFEADYGIIEKYDVSDLLKVTRSNNFLEMQKEQEVYSLENEMQDLIDNIESSMIAATFE